MIVEDDEKHRNIMKGVIDKFKYKLNHEVKTYEFSGLNKELENIIKNCDQRTIYILDIELQNSIFSKI